MKNFLLLFLSFSALLLFSNDISKNIENEKYDGQIVKKIAEVLIEEYDNYKDKTLEERFVLSLGKKTFIESVDLWTLNYKNINSMTITVNYHLWKMSEIANKNIEREKAAYFKMLLIDLTRLGYQNLQLYFTSVKSYLSGKKFDIDSINITLIDDAIRNPFFFEYKTKLYQEERRIKKEMLLIMHDKRLKYKIGFYLFAFNFLNKIREKVIDKDIARMESKIKNL